MFIKKIVAKISKEVTKITPKEYVKTYFPELFDKYNKSIEDYIKKCFPRAFHEYDKSIKDDKKRMKKAIADFRRGYYGFGEISYLDDFLVENNLNVWSYNTEELSECLEMNNLSSFVLVKDRSGHKMYYEIEETA